MTILSSPQGPFETGTIVSNQFLNWLAANLPKALDSAEGGDYQPANAIRIGAGGIACPDGSTWVIEGGGTLYIEPGAFLTIEGTTVYNDSVQINGDLDLNGNADVSGTLQTHGLLTVSGGLTMAETSNVSLTSRSITRVITGPAVSKITGGAPDWDAISNGTWSALSATSPAPRLMIPFKIPHGATLSSVTVYITPPGHGGSWPPANAPTLRIDSVKVDGTGAQIGSTATDSLASQAAYEVLHALTVGGLSSVIDRTTTHFCLLLTGENGVDALTGTVFYAATVTFTTTSYDED